MAKALSPAILLFHLKTCTMRILFLFFCLLNAGLFLSAQEPIRVQEIPSDKKPWSSLNLNNDPKKFHFVVVTDRTGGHRPGIFEKGVSKINLMQPEFVLSVGDLIEGYTTDRKELDAQWTEFNGFIGQLEMPFFYVAGNHDYTNQVMAGLWQQQFGADYYYFVYKNILFLCLNSEDGATALKNPDFSDKQTAFVEKVLAGHPNVDWTMAFMHQPLWLTPTAKNWSKVEKLLSDRKHTVFTGHLHQYALHNRNNSDYFVLATTGGGSSLRGKRYGEFDHVVWVTMTPTGPYYANVLLDGVEDKSIQTAENLARVERFNANPPVRFEPVFYSGKLPGTLSYKVVLNNTTNEDHEYTVALTPGKGLVPGQTSLSKKVPAGAREEMMVPVTAAAKGPWSPIVANVTVQSAKYEWKTKVNLQPNLKYSIGKTAQQVTVDGNLAEWGKLRFAKEDPTGNAGFSFDVREDANFLYVAMDVTDNDLQAGFGHSNLNQDGAFVVFDARPIEQSAFNERHKDGIFRGEWLFLTASPGGADFDLGFKELMPAGLTGKGKKTAKGYAVEFAIPQAVLAKFQGGAWKNVRMNFSIMDKDKETKGEPKQITWLPDWLENYPGSGTFFKMN